MRYGELEEGIDVLDADGNLVGSSKIAARHVGWLEGLRDLGSGLIFLYYFLGISYHNTLVLPFLSLLLTFPPFLSA